MGTRSLITVFYKGKFIIAQYSQWDGYPEGQGKEIFRFLIGDGNIKRLLEGLDFVHILEPEDIKSLETLKETECRCDDCTSNQFESLRADTGSKILKLVAGASEENAIPLVCDVHFVNDTLFCEWAYCVDLDERVFETFYGGIALHKDDTPATKRFREVGTQNSPVPVLVKSYSLDNLPKEEQIYVDEVRKACEEEKAFYEEEDEQDEDEDGDDEDDGEKCSKENMEDSADKSETEVSVVSGVAKIKLEAGA